MTNKSRCDFISLEKEVYAICRDFISPRGLSHFHFRRNYKDGAVLVLTNNGGFFGDFFRSNCREISYPVPASTRQSWAFLWDECLTEDLVTLTREKNRLYHGFTIINRHKEYYDCVAFAMPAPHPSAASWYLNTFHDLKTYSELFPKMAGSLIRKAESERIHFPDQRRDPNHKFLFLPQKSRKIHVESGHGGYVTTHELLCAQLLCEGKTYRQIGSILSISPRTVETYLARLKSRTNMAFHDVLTRSFKMLSSDIHHSP